MGHGAHSIDVIIVRNDIRHIEASDIIIDEDPNEGSKLVGIVVSFELDPNSVQFRTVTGKPLRDVKVVRYDSPTEFGPVLWVSGLMAYDLVYVYCDPETWEQHFRRKQGAQNKV